MNLKRLAALVIGLGLPAAAAATDMWTARPRPSATSALPTPTSRRIGRRKASAS